jgi:MSHA pilin protein MshD
MSGTESQRGVTLIEMVIFIVVVGIAVAGVAAVYSRAVLGSTDPLQRKQALLIAESLMEEVAQARITTNDYGDTASGATAEGWGPEPTNTRPYDTVNDYVTGAGVDNTTVFNNGAGQLADANGTAYGGAYTASISVAPAAFGAIAAGGGVGANCFLVTITVNYNNNQNSVVLQTYRTRYAPAAL